MNSVFMQSLQLFADTFKNGTNQKSPECVSAINHYSFYQSCLIPAALLTVILSCTKSRRQMFLDILDGRPGLVYPMDTLTSSSRISYCCAFGATSFLVYQILLEQTFAIAYSGPLALTTLVAVLSMFIYGVVFFPVFACLAMKTALSYGLGSLYVWVFLIVNVYQLTECNLRPQDRSLVVIRALPSLGCLGYLSVSLPLRFGTACYKRTFLRSSSPEDPYSESVEEIKASFQGIHVSRLLRKPEIIQEPQGALNKVKAAILDLAKNWIYHPQPGFRFPSRFISVMFIGASVVYVISIEFLSFFVYLSNFILSALGKSLDSIGWSENPQDPAGASLYRNGLLFVYSATYIFKVSIIVSIAVACTITVLSILHMMTSFRTNLFAMYRGDYTDIPPPSKNSAASLCVGSIKFAGFQVAYIVWGYIVQFIVLFIICVILATIICILHFGITKWLTDYVLQLWPSVLIAIMFMVLQMVLARYVFLQKPGTHLRLNNRRFFFIFNFFMFFYNIFLGLLSCLLRIVKAIGIGTLSLARLDNSTLPRRFEFFDPGFRAYQGYIHMEAAHTHPVVNVFIRLLFALSKSRSGPTKVAGGVTETYYQLSTMSAGSEDAASTRPVNIAARLNWHVVYTLLHNPAVRIHRRGYIEALQKARQKGLKIPISDKPITDFDLVRLEEDSAKEKAMDNTNNNDDFVCLTKRNARSTSDVPVLLELDGDDVGCSHQAGNQLVVVVVENEDKVEKQVGAPIFVLPM